MPAVRSQQQVGRDDEVATLRAAADRARAGRPAVVVVSGEPGIGKSRLVSEVATELRDRGEVVATGHAVDLAGGALPYGVVAGLVRDLRSAVGTERAVEVLGPRAAVIGALDPTFGRAEAADRAEVFEAVRHLVAELAGERLVCLVLEDLHWADPTSLDLLAYLVSSVTTGRLLVLATTRTEGADRVARLVARGELVSLRPLDDDAVRSLAAGLSASLEAPGSGFLDQVVALGQGVPLFVEELVAVQTTSPSGVPTALALGFTSRLAGVSREGRQVLDAVAVAEGAVPVALLRRVVGAGRKAVAAAVDEVAARGLLDVVGHDRVRFHHELLRRAVGDALPPLTRAEWHRRWAIALQRLDDAERADPTVLAALAHHWFNAGDAAEAVPAAVRAGRAATAVGAATESAVHWHRALLHWHRAGVDEDAVGLSHEAALVEGTSVLRLSGAYTEMLEVLTAERERPTSDAVLPIWLDLGIAAVSGRLGRPLPQPVPPDRLDAVLDLLAGEPRRPIVRATLFWLWWEASAADPSQVERLIRLLDDQVDPTALPSDTVGTGLRRARFALSHGDAEGALALLEDLLADVSALHAVNQPVVDSLRVWVLFVLGRLSDCIAEGERVLERLGPPELAGMTWAGTADNLAIAHAAVGHLDRAEELMRAILGMGDISVHMTTGCDLVHLLLLRGRLDEADAVLADVVRHELPGPGTSGYRFGLTAQVVAARAAVAAAHGDLPAARDLLRPVLADPHLTADSEYLWSVACDAARVAADPPDVEPQPDRVAWADDVRAAAARVHRHGAMGTAWTADVEAHLDRALGRDTVEGWQRVVDAWAVVGAALDEALARVRLAERLAGDGRREEATAAAADALATAERTGAAALADQVRAVARRARLRVDGAGSGDRGGHLLTTREREVLALLAEGRTNEQIAAGLFMSPKTASVHVSRIIAKLGVANRTEAAAHALRNGLVSDRAGSGRPGR